MPSQEHALCIHAQSGGPTASRTSMQLRMGTQASDDFSHSRLTLQVGIDPRATKLHKTRRKVSGGDRTDSITAAQSRRAGNGFVPSAPHAAPTACGGEMMRLSPRDGVLEATPHTAAPPDGVEHACPTPNANSPQLYKRSCKKTKTRCFIMVDCRVAIILLIAAAAQVQAASIAHACTCRLR